MNKIRKAVIPTAGLGTRFLPITKAVPKSMLPIVDTPTIDYIVDEAVAAGFNAGAIIKAMGPAIQGGGGGKPTMIQGSCTAPADAIKAFFAAYPGK